MSELQGGDNSSAGKSNKSFDGNAESNQKGGGDKGSVWQDIANDMNKMGSKNAESAIKGGLDTDTPKSIEKAAEGAEKAAQKIGDKVEGGEKGAEQLSPKELGELMGETAAKLDNDMEGPKNKVKRGEELSNGGDSELKDGVNHMINEFSAWKTERGQAGGELLKQMAGGAISAGAEVAKAAGGSVKTLEKK